MKSGFMGSVATGLAAHARRPVVVVPDTVPPRMDRYDWGAGTVVCGVDGSPQAVAAAAVAARVADALDTTLTLVCADDPWTRELRHADAQEILRATAEAVAPRGGADRVAAIGNAARQLARVARERDASMLVVGAHGRGHAGGRPVGTVATILSRLARCPVLIVPPALDRAVATAGSHLARRLRLDQTA
jgi:nucleotide-binding universal stress UspA family protein